MERVAAVRTLNRTYCSRCGCRRPMCSCGPITWASYGFLPLCSLYGTRLLLLYVLVGVLYSAPNGSLQTTGMHRPLPCVSWPCWFIRASAGMPFLTHGECPPPPPFVCSKRLELNGEFKKAPQTGQKLTSLPRPGPLG